MTQLAIDFDRARTAAIFVDTRPDLFRRDFGAWLAENWHVYETFERRADLLRRRGWRHHSARDIVHWIRHETAVREGPEGATFKVNNNWSPDLGRLYVLFNPDAEGFFEERERLVCRGDEVRAVRA